MFKFILHTLFDQRKKQMHESTLDLFCGDESDKFADEYAMELEMKAAELEITVDYYIAEFL